MKKYVFLFSILLCACASDEEVYTEIPEENIETPTVPDSNIVNGIDMSDYFSINLAIYLTIVILTIQFIT